MNQIEDLIQVCLICRSPSIGEKQVGDDDFVTVCNNCGAVERGYDYVPEDEATSWDDTL